MTYEEDNGGYRAAAALEEGDGVFIGIGSGEEKDSVFAILSGAEEAGVSENAFGNREDSSAKFEFCPSGSLCGELFPTCATCTVESALLLEL